MAMRSLPGFTFTLLFACTSLTTSRANDWDRWPGEPIKISPVEGVIEGFWNPALQSLRRWEARGGTLSGYWNANFLRFGGTQPGATASITRAYDLDLGDYQRLILRVHPGAEVRTTITAMVDGQEQTIVSDAAGSNQPLELSGPIQGKKLTQLTLQFRAQKPGSYSVQLNWVLLDKPGASWTPPAAPFEGMIVEGPVGKFEPGLGLVLGADELRRIRAVLDTPVYQQKWQDDLRYAAEQYKVDPASLLRRYSLYCPPEDGRTSDMSIPTLHDGIMLALVGMITENEQYMHQAARHAIVLAHVDEWAVGFIECFPIYPWVGFGFPSNTATIKASVLLDWTWHYLTPQGRELVRKAIREKGLAELWPARDRMANQGVRFNKGLVLGEMALADSLDDPELQQFVRACIDRINNKLDAIVHADGTFSEGFDYGLGTLSSTMITYQAASRCLGVPIREVATRRMLPAMRFVLDAQGDLNPTLAAFCAGPLSDDVFVSQCVPAGLIYSHYRDDLPTAKLWPWWPVSVNRTELIAYGLHTIWAPRFHAQPQSPPLPPFSSYGATRATGDVPPLNGGTRALNADGGPVNVGVDQDFLQDVPGATVAAWVKVARSGLTASQHYIYQSAAHTSSRLHLQVRGDAAPQPTGTLAAFIRRVDTDTSASLFSTATIPFGQWVHVAFVVDYARGDYSFYIDGTEAGSGTTGLSLGNSQDSTTSANWVGTGNGGNNLPGLIDDLRIYGDALAANEILRLASPEAEHQAGRSEPSDQPRLAVHYQFEGAGSTVRDLANPDGTGTPADDGVLAGGGWVCMGSDQPSSPRWTFESGLWDGHGHAWRHKHAITLRGWGQRLLITRDHLPYNDARSEYTQKTRCYNVFSPAERDQAPRAGRGAKQLAAEDLGPVALVESENGSAWSSGVQRAVRRAILFRPAVLVVHDDVLLSQPETGLQSWNSLRPWQIEDSRTCRSRVGDAAVRLTCLQPSDVQLTAGEDSVTDSPEGVVPVYRAAFTSPAARQHQLLTVIEAVGPGDGGAEDQVRVLETDGGCVELRQGNRVMRIAIGPRQQAGETLFGCRTDGKLIFAVKQGQRLITAGAFDATWLDTPAGKHVGNGFVRWAAPE